MSSDSDQRAFEPTKIKVGDKRPRRWKDMDEAEREEFKARFARMQDWVASLEEGSSNES